MEFKHWLYKIEEGGWFSTGKAQASLFKPGPKDAGPHPHDVKACGAGGGPGPCQGAGAGAAPMGAAAGPKAS